MPRKKYGKPIRRKISEEELQPGYNAHTKFLSRGIMFIIEMVIRCKIFHFPGGLGLKDIESYQEKIKIDI